VGPPCPKGRLRAPTIPKVLLGPLRSGNGALAFALRISARHRATGPSVPTLRARSILGKPAREREKRGRPLVRGCMRPVWVGAWIRAARAVNTRVPNLTTPVNHKLVAHGNAASRSPDPDARGGRAAQLQETFGPKGPPTGATS
jgi:hypothetical protein